MTQSGGGLRALPGFDLDQVDAINRGQACTDTVNVGRQTTSDIIVREVSDSGDVGSRNHILLKEWIVRINGFIPEHIKSGTGDYSLAQGFKQSIMLDDWSAADVDQKGTFFHLC